MCHNAGKNGFIHQCHVRDSRGFLWFINISKEKPTSRRARYQPRARKELIMSEQHNRKFTTGAQRDTGDDKLRMSLVPQQELKRVMERFLSGAEKYGENNWMKGMPLSVYYDCAHRHMAAWWAGDQDEDHAAAVVWNMLCAMWTETKIANCTPNTPDHEKYDELYDKHIYPNE